MEPIDEDKRQRMEQALGLFSECREFLFDLAPVMMHLTDENGIPVKVNRRWLATLGYEHGEALGHKSTDLLTDESRALALAEPLPLFWEAGRAHSIGYSLVSKNGRVLDILLDSVAIIYALGRSGSFVEGNSWGVEGSVKQWHFEDLAWVFS